MGMPLQQCRQSYQYMTPALRNHFTQQMADTSILESYNLTNPGVTFKVGGHLTNPCRLLQCAWYCGDRLSMRCPHPISYCFVNGLSYYVCYLFPSPSIGTTPSRTPSRPRILCRPPQR
jgi:hypothetical protein